MKGGLQMRYIETKIRPWRVDDTVVAKITDFGITKGREYKILGEGGFIDCFKIKDDTGNIEEYTDEYFEMKII